MDATTDQTSYFGGTVTISSNGKDWETECGPCGRVIYEGRSPGQAAKVAQTHDHQSAVPHDQRPTGAA